MSAPALWTAALLTAAVIAALVRLWLWNMAAAAPTPPRRLVVLMALQPVAAALLFLTLFPPSVPLRAGTLIVAAAGAPTTVPTAPGDILVRLPEAPAVSGAERVPDLATALRRNPGVARVRVVGDGLSPRDRAPLHVPLIFEPPAPARGLIDIAPPAAVSPGIAFSIGGQVGTLANGTVELADPAGTVVDRARVPAQGRFTLDAQSRSAGLALFTLRLRDSRGALVEQVAVPVETRDQVQPRVRVLAGAPGPETKYLARWAQESGIALSVDLDLGLGARVGEAAPLSAASLGETDLLVIDDRRWEALPAASRRALLSAIDGGLGLLLRPSGQLSPATRRDWAALGLPVAGGQEGDAVTLPGQSTAADDPPLELESRGRIGAASGAVAFLRDASGRALAAWRPSGRGRVGLWTVTDSYALVLSGRDDLYAGAWSDLFSALARPGDDRPLTIDGFPRAGERVAVCGLASDAEIAGPSGPSRRALVDPASGDRACAAYWPTVEGWHRVRDGRSRESVFYVHGAAAAPSLARHQARLATLVLAATPPIRDSAAETPRIPGSPWPWFIALLAVLAVLWWFERRPVPTPS